MIFSASAPSLSLLVVLCFLLVLMTEQAHGFTQTSSSSSSTHDRSSCTQDSHYLPATRTITTPARLSCRISISLSVTSKEEEQQEDSSATILSAKAKALQEKAEQLRAEIAALQDSKDQVQETQRQELQLQLDQQEAYMQHYSGEIPILKPDGAIVMEQVQFPPLVSFVPKEEENEESNTNENGQQSFPSEILVCEAPLPLGMILGQERAERNAMIVVDEVLEDSNAAVVAGIQEGDILRACTSCKMEMEQPTWQLLVGGIGRPKTVRFMFGTDDQPLETVLEALGANRMDPEARPVVLVVERPNKASEQ
ncbi:unnamed protein product [Cylindrotheca closterium]|uniref:PDZ domain-containing protein n=1 Tax=Cylindrotheca closterium TaxID=2856 RepID=A0AAD2PY81_9STRA|nr:unnamed protein product [Cylindrotheca closterium]